MEELEGETLATRLEKAARPRITTVVTASLTNRLV